MSTKPPELPGERLAKRVAQLLGCSRSEAEQYIEGGFVRVDGVVVEDPPFRVLQQAVTVDANASLLNLSAITLVLNKPPGWLDGLTEAPIPSPHYKGKMQSWLIARSLWKSSLVRARLGQKLSPQTPGPPGCGRR